MPTTSEVKLITPEIAAAMRSSMNFERQRTLSDNNIKRLGHEMSKGYFVPGTPIFICVLPDKASYIINGNHTLEAVILSSVPQILTLIYHDCANIEEVAAIYATFDNAKSRSWADSLRATGQGESLPHAPKILAAVRQIMTGFTYVNGRKHNTFGQSRTEALEAMVTYEKAAHTFEEAIFRTNLDNQRNLLRIPILAVLLECARYQPSAAAEFIHTMSEDDGLKVGDPRRTLLKWIPANADKSRGEAPTMWRAVAMAWNAYYAGEQLNFIRPAYMQTFTLSGTKWGAEPVAAKLKTGLNTDGSKAVMISQ